MLLKTSTDIDLICMDTEVSIYAMVGLISWLSPTLFHASENRDDNGISWTLLGHGKNLYDFFLDFFDIFEFTNQKYTSNEDEHPPKTQGKISP